jgi:very-short-patch-repair endonuclease
MNVPAEISLAVRVVQALMVRPGQKAADIARALEVERRDVNRCLSHDLAGRVQQDSAYRWSLRGAATAQSGPSQAVTSEIGRISKYYLECIGQDGDVGVNAFAASHGPPDYAELPRLPLPDDTYDWWNAPGAARLLGKVRQERGKLIAYIGYPVRLRRHRTARWEGFFVEPAMLWPIELPSEPGAAYELADGLPGLNFKFLSSLSMGDPMQLMEEATRLAADLGLANPLEDQPEVDEMFERLQQVRADWDWQERLDIEACSEGAPLSQITEQGIYNRAVILAGERSPYTQGLESELKELSAKAEPDLAGTALGAWLSGEFGAPEAPGQEPLLEVLPMNSEQRAAVHSALTKPLTVVTGPPGTGKSQVVTNLLVNAAWRGHRVLFASKNNKAVDVVEARVNGLGRRPVLLRLGSKEYQAKLGDYLTAMLSGTVTKDDEASYAEGLERHRSLAGQVNELDQVQARTLDARNRTDQLDASVDAYRSLLGSQRFNSVDAELLDAAPAAIAAYRKAIEGIDLDKQGFVGRLIARIGWSSRCQRLAGAAANLNQLGLHLGAALPSVGEAPMVRDHTDAADELVRRVAAARAVLAYQQALAVLRASPSFEDIARQRHRLNDQLAKNCAGLWRDFVQLTPKRLSAAERRDVADYAAVLQLINGPSQQGVAANVRSRARQLQQKVTKLFSCWAVTSLSVRGKVPFEPGYFDLVVIDEASQCDIASALPLLYRAKRAVIIGDPMQLRHISGLTRQKEGELQQKHNLVETRASWMYSVNSLYDVAAGVAGQGDIVSLKDHHRSHADIINFANQEFYGGALRVATRYDALRRPRSSEPGVTWTDVRGIVQAPRGGGAANPREAAAVIAALRDLLVTRGYQGSVGVVTPFRAQVGLLQRAIAEDAELTARAPRAELLVDTVHKFQGDERDVMFFSPVISEGTPNGALGFLRANGNLFNVAITRARGLLHVVGDRDAARSCGVEYLERFSRHVEEVAAGQVQVLDDARNTVLSGPNYPTVSNPERVSLWEHHFYAALFKAGLRPIPQFKVEQYDLDFALFDGDRCLNIEVDGERYHRSWTGELCARDQLRNLRLIELGWEVKRFWVPEIRDRLEDCVRAIVDWSRDGNGQ